MQITNLVLEESHQAEPNLLLNICLHLKPVVAARAIHSTYRHVPRREITRDRFILSKSVRDLCVPLTEKAK